MGYGPAICVFTDTPGVLEALWTLHTTGSQGIHFQILRVKLCFCIDPFTYNRSAWDLTYNLPVLSTHNPLFYFTRGHASRKPRISPLCLHSRGEFLFWGTKGSMWNIFHVITCLFPSLLVGKQCLAPKVVSTRSIPAANYSATSCQHLSILELGREMAITGHALPQLLGLKNEIRHFRWANKPDRAN